jgi:hypothetical protein
LQDNANLNLIQLIRIYIIILSKFMVLVSNQK